MCGAVKTPTTSNGYYGLYKKVPAASPHHQGHLVQKFEKQCHTPSEISAPCFTHTAQGLKRLAGIRFTRVYKKWGSGLCGGLRGGKAG